MMIINIYNIEGQAPVPTRQRTLLIMYIKDFGHKSECHGAIILNNEEQIKEASFNSASCKMQKKKY